MQKARDRRAVQVNPGGFGMQSQPESGHHSCRPTSAVKCFGTRTAHYLYR
jgi:hypothetical protein